MSPNGRGGSTSEAGAVRATIAIMLLLMISIIIIFMLQGLKRPDSSMLANFAQFEPATLQVIPGQATTVSAGSVSVYLPQEAATVPGSISILPREPDLFPSAGDTIWTRPQVVEIEYADPAGTPYPQVNLQQPAEVCFRLSPAQWTDYTQHLGNYQVHYYADDQNPPHWVLLPQTTHPEQMQLCGKTRHFSLFALAIKSLTGVPLAGVFELPTPFPSPIPTNRPGNRPALTGTAMPFVSPTTTGIARLTSTVAPTDPAVTVQPTDTSIPPGPTDTNQPPGPTNTPQDTSTPKPTSTPRDTSTPRPTSTPRDTATPKPPRDTPTPKPPKPTKPPKVSPTPVAAALAGNRCLGCPLQAQTASSALPATGNAGDLFLLLGLVLVPGTLFVRRVRLRR